MSDDIKNFFPYGKATRRPGLKRIPFRQRNPWGRFMMWLRGEPQNVAAITSHGNPPILYAATDKGLFYFDEKDQILKPIPYATNTHKEE